TVTLGSGSSTRFVGEVAAWPVKWDPSGRDVYVEIQAAGVLRRLSQGAAPLRDAVRRLAVLNDAAAYWPVGDPGGAGNATPALGRFPLVFSSLVSIPLTITTAGPNYGQGALSPHLPQAMATAKASTGAFSGGQLAGHIASSGSVPFAFDVL